MDRITATATAITLQPHKNSQPQKPQPLINVLFTTATTATTSDTKTARLRL